MRRCHWKMWSSKGALLVAAASSLLVAASGIRAEERFLAWGYDGCSRPGDGHFGCQTPPQKISATSAIQKLGSPLRMKSAGRNVHHPCTIRIAGTAVSTTRWTSATLVKGNGADLKTPLPKSVTVQVTVIKDDGRAPDPLSLTR